mmetsp:Transcript_5740/g.12634  ORF Transcript_5740/g.12634 Transcript_5740/m.12634 type:complete len:220 (+) Transcript_5740:388-1047(+)
MDRLGSHGYEKKGLQHPPANRAPLHGQGPRAAGGADGQAIRHAHGSAAAHTAHGAHSRGGPAAIAFAGDERREQTHGGHGDQWRRTTIDDDNINNNNFWGGQEGGSQPAPGVGARAQGEDCVHEQHEGQQAPIRPIGADGGREQGRRSVPERRRGGDERRTRSIFFRGGQEGAPGHDERRFEFGVDVRRVRRSATEHRLGRTIRRHVQKFQTNRHLHRQ